jgi:cytochrome c oxidase subunit 4
MEDTNTHITGYTTFAVVLIVLLMLTAMTVTVAGIRIGAYSAAAALVIAAIKVRTVIIHFMHLKTESRLLKLIVIGVFTLYGLVIIVTFIDYLFR